MGMDDTQKQYYKDTVEFLETSRGKGHCLRHLEGHQWGDEDNQLDPIASYRIAQRLVGTESACQRPWESSKALRIDLWPDRHTHMEQMDTERDTSRPPKEYQAM